MGKNPYKILGFQCLATLDIPRNDAMLANNILGEADIIHEVNIICKAASFAEGKHHSKSLICQSDKLGFLLVETNGLEPSTSRV